MATTITQANRMLEKSLAEFLAQPTKELADEKIEPVINIINNYLKRIQSFKSKINKNVQLTGLTAKGHITNALQLQKDVNTAIKLMSTGYVMMQTVRKMITGQDILYHSMIDYGGENIQVVEFTEKDLFQKGLLFIDKSVTSIEKITLRLSDSKSEFEKSLLKLDLKTTEFDEETGLPIYKWDTREKGLYRKLVELRQDLGISPQSVTLGHIFEITDRVAIARQRAGRIEHWYEENELEDLLKQRDNVESRKRADSYNIQNKMMKAQITSLGQVEIWAKELLQLFQSFKTEGVNYFKEQLLNTFTSDEQISDDILGAMERELVEDNRKHIQEIFSSFS